MGLAEAAATAYAAAVAAASATAVAIAIVDSAAVRAAGARRADAFTAVAAAAASTAAGIRAADLRRFHRRPSRCSCRLRRRHSRPFSWSEISADATRFEEGRAASAIARLPLWPQGQPDELLSLWQELQKELLATKQDWQVWISWHEDRLDGCVRDDERELAYVRIDEALWDQGPAIVNAELARQFKGERAAPS